MTLIIRPNTYVPGAVIRSNEVNNDFNTIYLDYNGNINDDNIVALAGIQWSKINTVGGNVDDLEGSVPIGSMIWFYDFNGALTFSGTHWAYCNGQNIAVGGLGLQTLPDASNRYIVGFGTEGGSDIGTALWATAAVGNASHQSDISHTHDVNIASFTSGSGTDHTHSAGTYYAPDHYHGRGSLATASDTHYHKVVLDSNGTQLISTSDGSTNGRIDPGANTGGANDKIETDSDTHTHSLTGTIGNTSAGHSGDVNLPLGGTSGIETAHTHSINPPNTTSASGGSTTQSIQPRSIRARLIMRIA